MKKLFELWWYNTLYHFNVKLDTNKIPKGKYCYKNNDIQGANDTPEYPFINTEVCPYYRYYSNGKKGCMYMAYTSNHNLKLNNLEKVCNENIK
jgi:hypothetical protein